LGAGPPRITLLAVLVYRGPSGGLDEAAQRMLLSMENRLRLPLGGLAPDEVAALAAAVTAGPLERGAVQQLYLRTGGHALYLRTVLSEGSAFDPRAPRRLALPTSLAAAISSQLRVLPTETRVILEMLAVLNLRMALAQLGQAAQIDSPSAAIEPAVTSGLVDWWPGEPTCPVEIRHPLVRDAIYADTSAARRRMLHAHAAAAVSESASWAHRVAALDRPDEGLAAELERLAGQEIGGGHLVQAATHLRWASDISPARADRERRLLTAALHLPLAHEVDGLALRPAVEAAEPSLLRNCVLGTMAFASGQLLEAEQRFSEALAQARADPDSQPLAALIADRLAGTYIILGQGEKAVTLGRWAVGTGCLDAAAASQTRALIAIGVSQVAGPRNALADLGHLDADPARVGPADVDGLTFRGVFRLLVGDLGGAVSDMTASFKMVRKGAILHMGLRTSCYLALAQYLAGAWDDALLTSEQWLSAAVIHPHRYDLPMLHLAHGRLLRRTGNRKGAVARLRRANDVYLALRAVPFIARVHEELAKCDLPAAQATKQSVLALTSRETEVAYLVGKGLSNPEIAAEPFISRKAVEYHLGNIYAKCGLRGRQELRRFVGQWRQPAAV
jgi:DNA-binding CsgD family transcriptional regulator